MKHGETYTVRHACFPGSVGDAPEPDFGMAVVVPAYDEQTLIPPIEALWRCQRPPCSVEVFVVFNASEKDPEDLIERNSKAAMELSKWLNVLNDPHFRVHILYVEQICERYAGAGMARKIGMDEAARRFALNGKDGIIVSLDADCLCDNNYLRAIHRHFADHPETTACSIHFEHPLKGNAFPNAVYRGIAQYELYLRYYRLGLEYAGLPYAFHTVGSAMACRSSAYRKQGGMNRRKAGEDFYFLQKFIKSGGFTAIYSTRVIPSPRPSHRVLFGTGRAVSRFMEHDQKSISTLPVAFFKEVKSFVVQLSDLYDAAHVRTGSALSAYLKQQDFEENLAEIRANVASLPAFRKRFFRWFDALKVLKFSHFAIDQGYYHLEKLPLAARELIGICTGKEIFFENLQDLLQFYRDFETNYIIQ